MKKKLEDLKIGDTVWDMHNGEPKFEGLIEEPVWVAKIEFPTDAGHDFIQKIMGRSRLYVNKLLVVVDDCDSGRGAVTLAYSYDGLRFGEYQLSLDLSGKKDATPTPRVKELEDALRWARSVYRLDNKTDLVQEMDRLLAGTDRMQRTRLPTP